MKPLNTITVGNRALTPSKIVCVGRNYVEHIRELGNDVPEEMVVFIKPNSAISNTLCAGKDEPLHYEGELCFVVEHGTLSAVGFGIDLTRRELQSKLKGKGLPWERAKAFDGAAVFSEFVELDADIDSLSLALDINGSRVQTGETGMMLYRPGAILAELQTFMSLNDGDVIMTGTPKGVGVIHAGDQFEGQVLANGCPIVSGSWVAVAGGQL